MIKLRGKTGQNDPSNKIIFEPRSGFTRGRGASPTLDFPLIYGHRCPVCSNVMVALFKAPKPFSLWPYEETTILSQGDKNAGEVLKVVPDDKVKFGKSCYQMDYSPVEGGSIKLTLRNHIVRFSILSTRKYDGTGIWDESYERPCLKAGIFSLREDLLTKDFLLFSQITEQEILQYNLPPIKTLLPESNTEYRLVDAVGVAPPVILVDRQPLVYGFNYKTRTMITQYKKGR
jgi:hypothetical protein